MKRRRREIEVDYEKELNALYGAALNCLREKMRDGGGMIEESGVVNEKEVK